MLNGKNEVFAKDKILSYKDYMALPETTRRYEIINGEVIMAPSPTVFHQLLVRNLSYALHRHVTEKKLGYVLFAPIDVLVSIEPFHTRQPDVLFISKKRNGFIERDLLLGAQLLDFAPELVIEVLSPSDTRSKMEKKLADYQKIGVLECWLVSPEAETVEVLKLECNGVERLGIFGVGDEIRSEILPELALQVNEIFG
jgi:Uma2 family endonuclease